MKKLNKQRAKKKTKQAEKDEKDKEEGTVRPMRNFKSELISAVWDIEHNQFPVTKIKFLGDLINARLEETEGEITKDITDAKVQLGRLKEDG